LSANSINTTSKIVLLGLATLLVAGLWYTVFSEEEEDYIYSTDDAVMPEPETANLPMNEFEMTKTMLLENIKTYNPEVKGASLDENYTLMLAIPNETPSQEVYAMKMCGLYKDYGVKQVKIIDITSVAKAKSVSDWVETGQCACK
jgi:hypothetical protein